MTGKEFGNKTEKFRGRLTSLAERFRLATGLPDPAEDVAQEALMKLWELIRKDYPVKDTTLEKTGPGIPLTGMPSEEGSQFIVF